MFNILLIILKRKKYLVIAMLIAIVMSALFYYLMVVNVYHQSIIIYAEMNGTIFTIISVILGIIISVLFGAYLALLWFRRDIVKARAKGNKISGASGVLTGIIGAGCPSCGAPILGLFGLPLGLFSLPFKGIELKILSFGFLYLAIFLISKNIKKNLVCEAPAHGLRT